MVRIELKHVNPKFASGYPSGERPLLGVRSARHPKESFRTCVMTRMFCQGTTLVVAKVGQKRAWL